MNRYRLLAIKIQSCEVKVVHWKKREREKFGKDRRSCENQGLG